MISVEIKCTHCNNKFIASVGEIKQCKADLNPEQFNVRKNDIRIIDVKYIICVHCNKTNALQIDNPETNMLVENIALAFAKAKKANTTKDRERWRESFSRNTTRLQSERKKLINICLNREYYLRDGGIIVVTEELKGLQNIKPISETVETFNKNKENENNE